jgi:Ca-activated chloride channel family protein
VTFIWPLALLGLLLVPLAIAGYVLTQRRRSRYAVRFTNVDLLANLVDRVPSLRRHLPAALVLLALTALLVALARPQISVAVPRREATVMLAMDSSGSMNAHDVSPNREAAARSAALRFVRGLPRSFDVGVVTFASMAAVVSPPTRDRPTVEAAIGSLHAGGATALGDAIQLALEARPVDARRNPPAQQPPRVILVLSDGKNTQGHDPLEVAQEARRRKVPVYTIALGTAGGYVDVTGLDGTPQRVPVPPDPDTLRQVAAATHGQAFAAADEQTLHQVYARIASRVGHTTQQREVTAAFLGAGILLLLAGGTLSALWLSRLP